MPKKKHEERPHHAPSVICYVFLGWESGKSLPENPRRISIALAREQHFKQSDSRCAKHCEGQCQKTNWAGRGH